MTTTEPTSAERLDRLESQADRIETLILEMFEGEALTVGVAIERSIARTGRCVCGRRPTLRDRLRARAARWVEALPADRR